MCQPRFHAVRSGGVWGGSFVLPEACPMSGVVSLNQQVRCTIANDLKSKDPFTVTTSGKMRSLTCRSAHQKTE